jgi:hypothetical protein
LDSQNRGNSSPNQDQRFKNRRRRYKGPSQGQGRGRSPEQENPSAENRNRSFQHSARRRPGRVLTINQVMVKYDNLLEQHLVMRKKYFEYFNRVDDKQLKRLEKNFFDSIDHLRRFEDQLEPWQKEALEKRRTERYQPDLTYSLNRGWNPEEIRLSEFAPDENEDPHFKDSQREAFEEYKEDKEESEGSFEDYLNYKGIT